MFSIRLTVGRIKRIIAKYRIDASWPIIINGYSTGCPPIQVNVNRSATKIQNMHWLSGRNIMLRCLDRWSSGKSIRIRIENTKAKTPPILLGMDRRIA